MGVVKSQGIKTSGVAYIGAALGAINTLWLFPAYLNPEEIGLITILTSISLIISPIAQLGVNAIILKYYPYFKGDEKKEPAFIFFILLIPTAGFLISMLLLLLCRNLLIENFQENSPLLVEFLYMLIPFTFLFSFRNIADTFSRALLKITIPRFYKEVLFRIFVIVLTLLYFYTSWDLTTFIYAYAGALFINLLLLLLYIGKLYNFKITFSLKPFESGFVKSSLIYGMFIILSGFANTIVLKIDGWMVSSKIDLANTGIYTIAMYIGLAIEIPKRSINLISLPIVSEALKNNKIDEVDDLYRKSSLVQLIIGSILLICIWINIDSLFEMIPNGDIYKQGKYVVLFIGLGVLLDMATGINNEIIYISNFYRYHLVLVLFLIVISIVNNLWLIPIYGITGAAMATAISLFLFNISKYFLIWFHLKIQPFTKHNLLTIIISLVVLLVGLNIPSIGVPIVDIGIKSIVVLSLFGTLIYHLKVSTDINKLIDQISRRIRKQF